MIEIQVRQKIKTWNGPCTLAVDRQYQQTDITHLYGVSGSGKTTLLKIIAGFIRPESGLIRVQGTTWLDTSGGIDMAVNLRRPGFVFQNYALFPQMTVCGHMNYACKDEVLKARLLELAGLENFSTHLPAQLSSGQQQRLGIIRALATKPRILLMDEPFSALDEQTKKTVMEGLRDFLAENSIYCLVASHNHAEMNGFATTELDIGTCLI